MTLLKFVKSTMKENTCGSCSKLIPQGSESYWNGSTGADKKNYCKECGANINAGSGSGSGHATSGSQPANPPPIEAGSESPMSPDEGRETLPDFSVESNILEAKEYIYDLYKKQLKSGTVTEAALVELVAEKAREEWQLWVQKRKEEVWRDV